MARQMKDSGIEWIGEIPANWELQKGKYLYRQRSEKGNSIELQLLSPTQKYGVIPQSLYEKISGMKPVQLDAKADLEQFKSIYAGDFCISLRSFQGGFEYSQYNGVVSPAYQVFYRQTDTTYDAFYRYIFKEIGFIGYMNSFTKSFRDGKSIAFDDFAGTLLPVPPIAEQHRIAAFLDRKCAEIDAVIERTKATIEEYKKLKQAVITEAVTKGVRGPRPMKDSGIEWIGEIPEEWRSAKLKYCTYIRARLGWKGLKADEYVESGYPFLSAFNIVNSKLDYSAVNYINQFRYDESPEIKLAIDDILLVKDGAGIGKCAIVDYMPIPATPNGSLAVVTVTDNLEPKFLYYYFLSKIFQKYIDRVKDGMGVPHLFQSDLKEICVVFGNIEEQRGIIAYLDEKCAALDTLIAKKTDLLTELETYKKSLIYEYVTGKKEV